MTACITKRELRRWGLVVALLAACGAPEPQQRSVSYDLATRLPLATVIREPQEIRFGSPEAGQYLLGGWLHASRGRAQGPPFVWSKGPASALRLPLLVERDLRLTLKCRPYRFPEAPSQVVTIEVNAREVAELKLDWGVRDYTVTIPASALVGGENRLVFRYAWTRSPDNQSRSGRARELAVAWYNLRVENALEFAEGEPLADAETGRLFIPLGTRLDFYLDLPAESSLAVADWAWRGTGGARAEVTLETDGTAAKSIGVVRPEKPLEEVALTKKEGAIVRLGIRAIGSEGVDPGDGGVGLNRPVILSPAEPAAEPEPIAAPVAPESPPNILIYMIDTLRADHLGTYGYQLPVSPEIDAFAAGATVFENAIGQSSWTKASVASVLTGLWPVAHGANRRGDKLSDDALTLGEILQRAGYRTAGVGANPNVSGAFGFRQGFDEFVLLRNRPQATLVHQLAFDWLDQRRGEAPFFLYLHTVEPHDPYSPPQRFRERFAPDVSPAFAKNSKQILKELRTGDREPGPRVVADLLALYDAEIAHLDAEFGNLLDGLRERGLYENTLIVLVSDHGEEFFEHGGWTHGHTLHSESLNVPLIVRFPGQQEGRRVAVPVQHIDILPTILEGLGLPPLAGIEGRSLRWLASEDGDPFGRDRRIYSYLDLDQVHPRAQSPVRTLTSVVEDEWKLVHNLGSDSPTPDLRLYRWRRDGGETENLSWEYPVLAGWLRTLAAERLLAPEQRLESDEAVIDAELEESLRALGYLP